MSQQTFVAAAESFFEVVESSDTRSRIEFVRDLERSLADLYAAGLTLDDVDPDDDSPPPSALTNDEAAALQRRLGEKLGDIDFFSVVFDPYDFDTTPVTGSLADDLADIYRDLQDGFAALRNGATANALWQWKFGFETHWGKHAVEAMYALYNVRSKAAG
jgi:hypothetical protein